MQKLKLKTPIKALDDSDIVELNLKPITGAMWIKHGDLEIAKITNSGGSTVTTIEVSQPVFMAYLEESSGLPAPVLRSMCLRDLMAARAVLQSMFQD